MFSIRGAGELYSLAESPNANLTFRFNEMCGDAFRHCSPSTYSGKEKRDIMSTKLKRITVSLRNEDVEFLDPRCQFKLEKC